MSTPSTASAARSANQTPAPSSETRWNLDASHSVAHFSVRHMMVTNVRGQISGIQGQVVLGARPEDSRIEATLDLSTIDTREAKRDAHLKSPDFFDVEKFPTMKFVSRRVEKIGGESLRVTGDLTIHGVTREVVLDVTAPGDELKDPWGGIRRGAQATTKINRKDFGLGWNVALETGGVLVGDNVTVDIELSLVKAS